MAGRGTDIVLGGNLEAELAGLDDEAAQEAARAAWEERHQTVLDAGGLHIVGTERHESRRIDNQLRGRAGRQGDPGASRFYISLDDNLMRIFMGNMAGIMQKVGMERGEAIESGMVTNSIERAQQKVEDATSTFVSSCWSTMMSPMTSARLSTHSVINYWMKTMLQR